MRQGWEGCVARPMSSARPWDKLVSSRHCVPIRPPAGAGRPGLAPWRPQRLTHGVLLGARGSPGLWPAGHGAAPAACRYAHAALAPLLAICLALRPIVPVAGPAGLG